MTLDLDLERGVEPDRDGVPAAGVDHAPAARGSGIAGSGVQVGIEVAQRGLPEVDHLDGGLGPGGHQTSARSQT